MAAKKPTEVFARSTDTVVEPSEVRTKGTGRFAQPPASAEGLVGSVVADRYLVHELLGAGGMGEVYEAEHVHMKKRVALKVLHGELVSSQDIVQRFEREAIAAGRIRHPGVVTATDFGPLPDGSFYLALELIDGRSLSEEIARGATFTDERVFGILFQIAAALEAAHAAGIVHRDLKPENVMLAVALEGEDFVKVLDFGIAKIRTGTSTEGPALTRAGMIFGTPEYMSPEQARGESVDERSDLYALGMIGYEMLTGRTAFQNPDLVTVLRGQMLELPPPLPDHVGAGLAAIVLRLLEKEPTNRPASATALLGELFALAEAERWPLPEPKTAVGTRVDLRASRGMEVVPWGHAPRGVLIQPLQSLRALSMHPVSLGPRKVPLWLPAVALSLGLVFGGLWIRSSSEPGEKRATASSAPGTPTSGFVLPDLEPVRAGDRSAIGELRKALTVAEQERVSAGRSLTTRERDALADAESALAEGYVELKLFAPALAAYGSALEKVPSMKEDRRLLGDVLRALEDRDSFDEAVRFCVTRLGSVGADLVYEAFLRVRDRADASGARERLARALRAPDVRSVASPALEFALELERAKVCAEYRAALAEHGANADARSLPKLEALSSERGCGKDSRADCFPCLRGAGSRLPPALAEARRKASPKWDDL